MLTLEAATLMIQDLLTATLLLASMQADLVLIGEYREAWQLLKHSVIFHWLNMHSSTPLTFQEALKLAIAIIPLETLLRVQKQDKVASV